MANPERALKYKRVLLKLSGEALCGDQGFGIKADQIEKFSNDIKSMVALGAEVAVVTGAGNYCRGAEFAKAGFDRISSDHIGMLATVMNAIALRDVLTRSGVKAHVRSAFAIDGVVKPFYAIEAMDLLSKGEVVICAGGTGHPLVTTDTTAVLRAIEIKAELLLKATKVDGMFSADPKLDPSATFFPELSYAQVISKQLAVMDLGAMCMSQENQLPVRVFNMNKENVYSRILTGESVGTLVH